VRYKDTPRAFGFDLAKESDEQLIQRLASPNVYYRVIAQRLLAERNSASARERLQQLVFDDTAPRKARMHGLWALVGGGPLEESFHAKLLEHHDPGFRAWGVRAAGNMHEVSSDIAARVAKLASDPAADVKLQVAIAARKIAGLDALAVLSGVLAHCGQDKLIPHIVWQNLHPLLEDQAEPFLARLEKFDLQNAPWSSEMLPLLVERLLSRRSHDAAAIAALVTKLADDVAARDTIAPRVLATLAARSQSGELAGARLQGLQSALRPLLAKWSRSQHNGALPAEAVILSATWNDSSALEVARRWFQSDQQPVQRRLKSLHALVASGDQELVASAAAMLPKNNAALQEGILAALSRLDDEQVAVIVLKHYGQLVGEVRPKAIELLTERPAWTRELVAAVERKQLPAEALNVNQLRKLQSSKDASLVARVTKTWGRVRTDRNPQREQVVNQMRTFLKQTHGDPQAGAAVYKKVCGQCHKLFGDGQDVGPDITLNGRSNFEQLLSNVFDPSLVIGDSYQARTVATSDGRILVGLLVEDNPQRIVLKIQGGKLETIPRDNVDQIEVSKLSMMPEDLEKQLKPQELADLFAYITLDKPPSDPQARRLPGAQ
jgi:putative heme-binding domain-containing protein